MKGRRMLGAGISLALLAVAMLIPACGGRGGVELDVPEPVRQELQAGTGDGDFVYYALAESPPESWDQVQSAGLALCGEYPPLLPEKVQDALAEGGPPPGTLITVRTDDFVYATEGQVASSLGMLLQIPVGITFEGCAEGAIGRMEATPGLLLLTEADAAFEGRDKLVEVSFR